MKSGHVATIFAFLANGLGLQQVFGETCGTTTNVKIASDGVSFEFKGHGNPRYMLYSGDSSNDCHRMEFRKIYQYDKDGKKQDSESLNSWDWTWPERDADSERSFHCPSVGSFPTGNSPPPDMCSCLSNGTLCQFQMAGSKKGGTPDLRIVNWYNTNNSTDRFLKFDLYVHNNWGWTGAGAPAGGTVQVNFRLRNKSQDDGDDDDVEDDDVEDDDDGVEDNDDVGDEDEVGFVRVLTNGTDDDDNNDDGGSGNSKCVNSELFMGSVTESDSGLNVTLGLDGGECALAVDTWTEAFESGYELIDPEVGLDSDTDTSPPSSEATGLSTMGTVGVVTGVCVGVGAGVIAFAKQRRDATQGGEGKISLTAQPTLAV